jgi:hypothetical protein
MTPHAPDDPYASPPSRDDEIAVRVVPMTAPRYLRTAARFRGRARQAAKWSTTTYARYHGPAVIMGQRFRRSRASAPGMQRHARTRFSDGERADLGPR